MSRSISKLSRFGTTWVLIGVASTVLVLLSPVPRTLGGPPAVDGTPQPDRDHIDAQRRRVAEFKNRYEIELRNAMTDVANTSQELRQLGGENLGTDGCPVAIELKRWLQERDDLQVKKLETEVELNQFIEAKSQGQSPPSLTSVVDNSPLVVRSTRLLEAATGEADLAEAQKRLDQDRTTATTKAMSDLEASLKWQQKNLENRLDRIDRLVDQATKKLVDIQQRTEQLAARKQDVAEYKDFVRRYDKELQDLDQQLRDAPQKPDGL